jgi:hypothetical protein
MKWRSLKVKAVRAGFVIVARLKKKHPLFFINLSSWKPGTVLLSRELIGKMSPSLF